MAMTAATLASHSPLKALAQGSMGDLGTKEARSPEPCRAVQHSDVSVELRSGVHGRASYFRLLCLSHSRVSEKPRLIDTEVIDDTQEHL